MPTKAASLFGFAPQTMGRHLAVKNQNAITMVAMPNTPNERIAGWIRIIVPDTPPGSAVGGDRKRGLVVWHSPSSYESTGTAEVPQKG